MGIVLKKQDKLPEASEAFERALELRPDNAECVYNLGTTLHERGEVDRATDYYRQALRLRPCYPDASSNLATAYKEHGLLDEAIAQFRETLAQRPDHALAYYNLGEFASEGRYRFTADEIKSIQAILAAEHSSAIDRSLCSFALAKYLDRQDSYDEAFAFYKQANDLRGRLARQRGLAFDARIRAAYTDEIIAAHDRGYFARVQEWATNTELPIFIIGMPRSGSTLVEQIIASHPRVFGAGELADISTFVETPAQQQ